MLLLLLFMNSYEALAPIEKRPFWKRIFSGRIIKILLLLLILGGVAFYFYQKNKDGEETLTYVLAQVEKGTISTSVSGTGQVSASKQIDVQASASGKITAINAVLGQEVKEGDLLVQIDTKDALSSLRDAEINLESARLSLEKLKAGSSASEIASYQRKLESAQRDLADYQNDLEEAEKTAVSDLNSRYDEAQDALESAYTEAHDILARQLDQVFSDINTGSPELTFMTTNSQAETDSKWGMHICHDEVLPRLKTLSETSSSNHSAIISALAQAENELQTIDDFLDRLNVAVQGSIITLDFTQSDQNSFKSTVASAKSNVNSAISALLDAKEAIDDQVDNNNNNLADAKKKIVSAEDALETAQADLAEAKEGPDVLDVRAQELSVKQRQNALVDAREKLEDYSIKAPFDGLVVSLEAEKGDTVSSGASLLTIITKQQIAEISLNEVDAISLAVGQKSTLTFDAIENLSLTGHVAEIDSLGTVEQGVVTYNVKIIFDTQDERVKPGMTVSASIINDLKQNVLYVENTVLKSSAGSYYVEMPNEEFSSLPSEAVSLSVPLKRQAVEVGLANDEITEIISGLEEGDIIVSKSNGVVNASDNNNSNSSERSLFQMGGMGGGMPR